MRELLERIDSPIARAWQQNRPIDLRHVEAPIYVEPDPHPQAHQSVWMKTYGDAAGRPAAARRGPGLRLGLLDPGVGPARARHRLG